MTNYSWENCSEEILKNQQNIITFNNHDNVITRYLRMIMSSIGSVMNLAVLIVFYANKFNTRFDKLISAYSFASLVVSVHYLINCFVSFNYLIKIGFFIRLLFSALNQIFVSFCRNLDTFLVYERIQIYKPEIKFLSKTSFIKLTITILIVAVLTDSLELVTLMDYYACIIYKDCKDENLKSYLILENKLLKILCFFMILSELLFYFITDLILTVYLLKILKTFYRYKKCLRITACSKIRNKKVKRDNTITGIVLCSLSTLTSLAKFFTTFERIKFFEISKVVYTICESFIVIKYSINFFLFYFLNRKFRRSVNRIVTRLYKKSL